MKPYIQEVYLQVPLLINSALHSAVIRPVNLVIIWRVWISGENQACCIMVDTKEV